MQCRKYEDKNGNKREAWEIKVDKVGFAVGGVKSDNVKADERAAEIFADVDEDLPF